MSLEQALEFIDDDELVEVTPMAIRLRKKDRTESDRKKAAARLILRAHPARPDPKARRKPGLFVCRGVRHAPRRPAARHRRRARGLQARAAHGRRQRPPPDRSPQARPRLDVADCPPPTPPRRWPPASSARAQLTQAYLDRIAKIDKAGPTLNSVIELNPDALEEADALDAERKAGKLRGPLHGIPVLLKDNIDAAGMVNSAGSLALADNRPTQDAFLVARLRAAGAVILGKTNLSEWANFRSTRSTRAGARAAGRRRIPTCSIAIPAARVPAPAPRSPPASRPSASAPRPTAASSARPRSPAWSA